MASLTYLFRNRARFPLLSRLGMKAWAKRFLTLPNLLRGNLRRFLLVEYGATIHENSELGHIRVLGNKRNLIIGAFTFIGKAEVALHAPITIGNRVCINDGVKLFTASHDVNDPEWNHVKAPIIIEDYVWISTNVIVLPGVRIGKGAVIGAGAVVSKEVAAGDIVAGNPAIVLKKKRSTELIYNPCEFLAANQAWIKG